MAMPSAPSILHWIGLDIVGVMTPVSICMASVVLIVYSLSAGGGGDTSTQLRTAANLVYSESPSDSFSAKLEGSLLNAVVFVALIAAVTFLILLLYYYNFTAFLQNYMRFSVLFVLSVFGGSVFLSLLRHFSLPLDALTSLLSLLNFSAVGVLSLFSPAVPILLRQAYTVSIAVFVAAWFTKLPEWTTWSLLVALALYDLVAVLAPGGPLKLLVELASSRDDDLPALIYESRPSPLAGTIELQARNAGEEERSPLVGSNSASGFDRVAAMVLEDSHGRSGAIPSPPPSGPLDGAVELQACSSADEEERSPLVGSDSASGFNGIAATTELADSHGREVVRSGAIKLGLGDFVFYSVLVGRAAMYDLMTVYACYLAIIAGLGCTLILLSVHRKALPALPISIALGIVFYLLTRLLMEPFVVGAATNLLMF